ncbi:MAG: 4-hydroxythreonine-4-phosphate dehydrogenase PdxA [Anaerolineae bacterium]
MTLPIIALTMGDPAGVGPEIILKSLSDSALRSRCRPLIIGDPAVMARAAALVPGAPPLRTIVDISEAAYGPAVDVLPTMVPAPPVVFWGAISEATAKAMLAPLDLACDLALAGAIQGIVFGPLNKEAFHLCGYAHRDEVDYMGERTGCPDAYILGLMRGVWVTAVAEHVPFREIADLITRDNVLRYVVGLDAMMRRAGVKAPDDGAPRIAVAALNVHAGEGGALGTEEITDIRPAVDDACEQGVAASGPYPADTVFSRALGGEFEGVVAMFHDQANIARKLQPMSERVTLFEGLPVPGGTTAHGVAYDIAGRGVADPGSLIAALDGMIRLSSV